MDEENIEYKRWMESVHNLLGAVSQQLCQPYSIPVIPVELRNWNEDDYFPKAVSIGPRFRGRRDLQPMEEIKWRCVTSLLSRTTNPKDVLEKFMEVVVKLDAAVRASYVDEIKLDRYELATIMLFDGCFLLELFVFGETEQDYTRILRGQDYPSQGGKLRNIELVLSDLTHLENQIPLFVLESLFRIIYPKEGISGWGSLPTISHSWLIGSQALALFGINPDHSAENHLEDSHFLEIVSSYIHWEREKLKIEENRESRHASSVVDISGEEAMRGLRVEHLNRCATRLQAAGITIKHVDNELAMVDTVGTFKFNIKFNNSNGVAEYCTNNGSTVAEFHCLGASQEESKQFFLRY